VEPHLTHTGSVFEIPWVIRGMPRPGKKSAEKAQV
jgi:hypothetical protein